MKKIILSLLLIISVLTFFSCKNDENKSIAGKEQEHHPEEENVVFLNQRQREALDLKLGTFQMRNLTTVIKLNGQLAVSPSGTAEVSVVMGGFVTSINAFFGDRVKRGAVLAVLENPDYIVLQEKFAEVANNLEYLQKEFERQKQLYQHNIGAGKDFQLAKANYNTAKAQYEGLKARLEMLNLSPGKIADGTISRTVTVTSPINGFVNQIYINTGAYADPQKPLFEVSNPEMLHADFLVYEQDIFKIKKGQKVHFTVANNPQKEYTSTVYAVGKEFDPKTRAIHIHTKIKGRANGLLPGMYVSGHLHTDKKYTKTLPDDAIVSEGGKFYIFVKDHMLHNNEHGHESDEKITAFRMVEVMAGKQDGGFTEVTPAEPLSDSVKIVLNAAYYLLADMKKEGTEHEH